MAAIITDYLRINNAKSFVENIQDPNQSYYTFVGLPNSDSISPSWDSNPISPKDCFDEDNAYWESLIALKKISPDDIRLVVRKIQWESGTIYDSYRHDISRTNLSKPSNKTSLYSSNFYVINSQFRVYICLNNGIDPENSNGKPSLDEPNFTDLEPRAAGTSGDGYVWKYLYTVNPNDIVKFDSLNFIPVPMSWESSSEYTNIRNNALSSGQLKTIFIKDRGLLVGPPNTTYTNVPISGDGEGAECTIVVNNDAKVESITVSKGGSGYTFGTVDLIRGSVPLGASSPKFDVIIPPTNGHGYDIYRELGSTNVLLYSRIENDVQNPDFTTGTKISRIGIIKNPLAYNSSTILTDDRVSSLDSIKLVGLAPNQDDYKITRYEPNSIIRQTIGTGVTAVGRVLSYDAQTGVLKYWQDRSIVGFNTDGTINDRPTYGLSINKFTSNLSEGGDLKIIGGSNDLYIDSGFGQNNNPGISTVINNKTYYLGQNFVGGVALPEVEKYSGNIIYVDNRPAITRSVNQREDIKVVLQF